MSNIKQQIVSAQHILDLHIKEAKEAKKVLGIKEKERDEYAATLMRFCPFKSGDIIIRDKQMVYVEKVVKSYLKEIYSSSGPNTLKPAFWIEYLDFENRYNGSLKTMDILFEDAEKWTVLRNAPVELHEMLKQS